MVVFRVYSVCLCVYLLHHWAPLPVLIDLVKRTGQFDICDITVCAGGAMGPLVFHVSKHRSHFLMHWATGEKPCVDARINVFVLSPDHTIHWYKRYFDRPEILGIPISQQDARYGH